MDKKSLMQTSNKPVYTSLVPQHTQTFVKNQRAIIEVPTDNAFFDGQTNYISCDVVNTSADKSRWTFPLNNGAQSLIERVDIYSLMTGQHLETLENYNEWQALEIPYLNSSFDKERSLEGIGDPTICYSDRLNGYVTPDPKSVYSNLISPVDNSNNPKLVDPNKPESNYIAHRVTFPLRCGLFKCWGENKLVPNLLLQGLRIEIIFARDEAVCTRIGATDTNGVVYSYDRSAKDNQRVKLNNVTSGSNTANFAATFDNDYDTGLVVNNVVDVVDVNNSSNTKEGVTITAITNTQITFSSNLFNSNNVYIRASNNKCTYKVENLEFKILKYILDPKMRNEILTSASKNGFEYEFISYDYYPDNVPQTVKRHNSDINTVASKALSIFSTFVSVDKEYNTSLKSYVQGVIPDDNKCNSIQYFINGRLYPVQSYNPEQKEERVIVYNELQKCWKSLGRMVKRFGSYEGSDPQNYSNPFLFGRQLADENFYFDLVNAEPQLRLEFSGSRSNEVGNMSLRHFVFSKKTIVINDVNGLTVLN